jgi:hypothetical protein
MPNVLSARHWGRNAGGLLYAATSNVPWANISPACDGKAWRIDVGLSKYYGGPIEVLELRGDKATVLKESSPRR